MANDDKWCCGPMVAAGLLSAAGGLAAIKFLAPAPGPGRDFPGCPKQCGLLALQMTAGAVAGGGLGFHAARRWQGRRR